MHRIMKPALQPENIYAHPHQEQDVILWYNRALWHSIVSALSDLKQKNEELTYFRPNFPSLTVLV